MDEKLYIIKKPLTETVYDKLHNYISPKYDLQYNEISNDFQISFKNMRNRSDLNLNSLLIELAKVNLEISASKLEIYIKSEMVDKFNPIKSYFKHLEPWDGINHIANLASYVPTTDNLSFKYHLKKWLVRAVKCALERKYYNKQALILTHDKQNSGKSTFCRFFCPPDLSNYIAENIGCDKDANMQICRNFLVNLDEIDMLEKREIRGYKSLFSKSQINLRLPYDRKNTTLPRVCSFLGSTNDSTFLIDETGTVRWLCFELVDQIDFNYSLEIDINKVWAQAYHLAYKDDTFNCELTKEDILENEIRNQKFKNVPVEQELIDKYYSKSNDKNDFKMTNEIVSEIILKYPRANEITIGKAIRALGFERVKDSKIKRWGYLMKRN